MHVKERDIIGIDTRREVGGREREKERERQTDRQTGRSKERLREKCM